MLIVSMCINLLSIFLINLYIRKNLLLTTVCYSYYENIHICIQRVPYQLKQRRNYTIFQSSVREWLCASWKPNNTYKSNQKANFIAKGYIWWHSTTSTASSGTRTHLKILDDDMNCIRVQKINLFKLGPSSSVSTTNRMPAVFIKLFIHSSAEKSSSTRNQNTPIGNVNILLGK